MLTPRIPLLLSLCLYALPSFGATPSATSSSALSTSTASAELQAIQTHFSNAGLTSLLNKFNPSALLGVSFNGTSISAGQNLNQSQILTAPTLFFTPVHTSSIKSLPSKVTLLMADVGVLGASDLQQVSHWIINNIPLNKSAMAAGQSVPLALNGNGVKVDTTYSGLVSGLMGNGTHRYVMLLYAQNESGVVGKLSGYLSSMTGYFNLDNYVKSAGLGPIIAGNYFTVTNGTATGSLRPLRPSGINSLANSTSNGTTTGSLRPIRPPVSNSTNSNSTGTTSGSLRPIRPPVVNSRMYIANSTSNGTGSLRPIRPPVLNSTMSNSTGTTSGSLRPIRPPVVNSTMYVVNSTSNGTGSLRPIRPPVLNSTMSNSTGTTSGNLRPIRPPVVNSTIHVANSTSNGTGSLRPIRPPALNSTTSQVYPMLNGTATGSFRPIRPSTVASTSSVKRWFADLSSKFRRDYSY